MESLRTRIRTLALLGVAIAGVITLHLITAEQKAVLAQAADPGFPECSDGIDNDRDGHIDYPQDSGCDHLTDEHEGYAGAGLFLSLTDGKETVKPGESLVYTISLNNDRHEQTGVDVRFLLPHQADLISASDAGNREGVYIVWNDVLVHPGRTRQLHVEVRINPHSDKGLLVTAEAATGFTTASDTTRITKTGVDPQPKLRLSVTDGKVYAKPEEGLRYRILVRNLEKFVAQTVDVHAQLPPKFVLHEVTGRHTRESRKVIWEDLYLNPGEVREFFVSGHVERDAPLYHTITFQISSGASRAKDSTTVSRNGALDHEILVVSLTDGQQATTPGQILDYQITIDNTSGILATNVDVNGSIPPFAEFVDATEGGYWNGTHVHWKTLTVSPYGKRVLHYSVRVRDDAPIGTQLKTRAVAKGNEGYDVTDVGTRALAGRVAPLPILSPSSALRKNADRGEVNPGDSIGYTVSFRNTTDRVMHGVLVQDKFNPAQMRVLDPSGGRVDAGSITWNIPVLEPGAEWKKKYRMQVSPHAPHGAYIKNVASVRGDGAEALPLKQRTATHSIGVLTHLPQTGAGMDTFFLILTAMLGVAPAGMQLRSKSLI